MPAIPGKALHPNLHHPLEFLCFLNNGLAFFDGMRHRLLNINILTAFHRRDGDRRVPVVWRGGEDGVYIGSGQQLLVVSVSFCTSHLLGRHVQALLVHVAKSNDFNVLFVSTMLQQERQVVGTASPQADQCYVDAIIGAKNLRPCRPVSHASRQKAAALEKAAA